MAKPKSPKIKAGTPVIVHWFDAHQDSDKAGAAADLLETDCELLDIGYYVGSKGRFITIVTEKGKGQWDGHYRHTHHIPKVNIIKVHVLDEPTYSTGSSKPIQQASEVDGNARAGRKRRARGDGEGDSAPHPLPAQPTGEDL